MKLSSPVFIVKPVLALPKRSLLALLFLSFCLLSWLTCPLSAQNRSGQNPNQNIVLAESFESGIQPDPALWDGDLADFTDTTLEDRSLLQLVAGAGKNNSTLYTFRSAAYGSWQFWFRTDALPSNLNRAFIFLLSDRSDLNYLNGSQVNGYAIRLGENGEKKRLRLLRFDRGVPTEVTRSEILLEPETGYTVRIHRSLQGVWRLFASTADEGSLKPASPPVTDNRHKKSEYFGFLFRYTSANRHHFYLDDLQIISRSPPLTIDTVRTVDPETLDVHFSAPVDRTSPDPQKFQLADGTHPVQTDQVSESRIRLHFSSPLTGGYDTLTVRNIRKIGESAAQSPDPARILIASRPLPGDVIINEILFEPVSINEGEGQSEYIELYNRREHALSLEGLQLRNREDPLAADWTLSPIESSEQNPYWIPANGYALLYPETAEDFSASRLSHFFNLPYGIESNAIRFDRKTLGLPTRGETVILSVHDRGITDRVNYHPNWHNPNLTDSRGISLERIDPDEDSGEASNWSSSTDSRGGTPGRENSLFQTPPFPEGDQVLSLEPNPFSPDADGHEDHLFVQYQLEEPDYLLRVQIFDRYGRRVHVLAEGKPAGLQGTLIWDGHSENGQRNRIGIYIIHFEAYDSANGRRLIFRKPVVLARKL